MHGKKSDPGIVLQERLGAVSVMDIPVHDKDAIQSMHGARVRCAESDVSEDAETHGAVSQRMVTGRPDPAKTPRRTPVERAVDSIEETACSRRRGVPGSLTYDGVSVESATSCRADAANRLDVCAIMNQGQFIDCCMTSFDVLELLE